ncbi:ATPase WRNIP1-like isoform X3 [Rhipicephalus microplus]
MRPSSLDEFIGQSGVLGDQSLLRQLITSNRIPSMILWGPPGCGKTTLAHIIANKCKQSSDARFATLSATTAGVKDVKDVLERARNDQKMFKKKTVLFIDEIHRFNKLQQDVFLPAVESGTIVLVGATTENPSFSLNSALLSRCRIFMLKKLPTAEVALILHRALAHLDVELVFKNDEPRKDLPSGQLLMEEAAVDYLAAMCDGDARTALNSLQTAVEAHRSMAEGQLITAKSIKEGLKRTHFHYDRAGDQHYDIISAFIKSMRGGDANAALYYMARMLAGGEDPLFIARRLVIFASEDIGVADSHALVLAMATHDSVMKVGLPECRFAPFVHVTSGGGAVSSMYRTPPSSREPRPRCEGDNDTNPEQRKSCQLLGLPPEYGPPPVKTRQTTTPTSDTAIMTAPVQPALISLRQPKEPPTFCGTSLEDPESWLEIYDHFAAFNNCSNKNKLCLAYFYLEDSAKTWFENRVFTPNLGRFPQRILAHLHECCPQGEGCFLARNPHATPK